MRFRRFWLVCLVWVFSLSCWADEIVILTGGTSGVYFPVGMTLKEIFEREIPGSEVKVMSTQATVENLNLLQRGAGHLALAQGDILSAAWEGNPEAGFPSSRTKIRLVGAAYPNYVHVLARADAAIATLDDLAGKRVSVGAARSGNELNARALLGAAGLSYADLLHVEYLHYGESVELLVKGELDAVVISAGLGVAAVIDASERTRIAFVPIEAELVQKNPRMFFPTSIPAGTYPDQADAVPTAALNNYFVTSSDAPEEAIYRITKAIFGNLESIRSAHPATRAFSVDNALAVRPIEVHPGALRYFRESGIAR